MEQTTKIGSVVVESNKTYHYYSTTTGEGPALVVLDSVVKLVGWAGEVMWEARQLAQAIPFHIDDKFVGCSGKDPALLVGIAGEVDSREYAAVAVERLEKAPVRVVLLEAATGRVLAEFDLPSGKRVGPVAIVRDSNLSDGNMVLSTVLPDAGYFIGFLLSDATDGSTVKAVDFREVLPGVDVSDLYYTPAGMVAAGQQGTVSVLALDGQVLWTATPKGASERRMPDGTPIPPQLVRSFASGLVIVNCLQTNLYRISEGVSTSFRSVTVFGRSGEIIYHQRNLKQAFRSARAADRVLATGEGARVGEEFLYVFDMGTDAVTVSRAAIPDSVGLAISPSGEYVLVMSETGGGMKVRMYKLG